MLSQKAVDGLLGARLLFVGGAPRSGTTMVTRALDWHPDVLMLLREMNVLRPFFTQSADQFRAWLFDSFLEPGSGNQSIYANESALKKFVDGSVKTGYRDVHKLGQLDPRAFRAAYADCLNRLGRFDIQSAIVSVFAALLSELPGLRERYAAPKYLAIKMPFWVEVFADQVAALYPTAHFIHVLRDPVDRYISAKVRTLKKTGRPEVGSLNGTDYPGGQMDIAITSDYLARRHHAALPDRYHLFSYEHFLSSPKPMLQQLCAALEIRFDDVLTRQTLLGQPFDLDSSFGFLNRRPLINKIQRFMGKLRTTSFRERKLLRARALCARDPGCMADSRFMRRLARWMTARFKHESTESSSCRAAWLRTAEWAALEARTVAARTVQRACTTPFAMF